MSVDPATFEIQSLYYQNAYAGCIALARRSAPSGIVDDVSLLQLAYAARAAVALRDFAQARQLIGDEAESPLAMSVLLLADYMEASQGGDAEDAQSVLDQLQSLLDLAEPGELASEMIRYNVGLALFTSGNAELALETLGVTGAGGSRELECVALGVHILLAIHRVDLAEKEYMAVRQWGDDSLLVQFMEAWIGLVRGGRATQQAYYVYDELSQSSTVANTANMVPSLVGKAVANAALGDSRGARAVADEAAAFDPADAAVASDQAVFTALAGDASAAEFETKEAYVPPTYPALSTPMPPTPRSPWTGLRGRRSSTRRLPPLRREYICATTTKSATARAEPARKQGTWHRWRKAPVSARVRTRMRVGTRPRKKPPTPALAYTWRTTSSVPRKVRFEGSIASVCMYDLMTSIGYTMSHSTIPAEAPARSGTVGESCERCSTPSDFILCCTRYS